MRQTTNLNLSFEIPFNKTVIGDVVEGTKYFLMTSLSDAPYES